MTTCAWPRLLAAVLFFSGAAFAEDAEPKVYRERLQANWVEGGARFWYRNDNPGGAREFVLVDAEKGTRQPAFDHESIDPKTIERLEFDQQLLRLIGREKSWNLDLETGKITEAGGDDEVSDLSSPSEKKKQQEPATDVASPDKKWAAFVRDDNLWVRSEETGVETRLTTDANATNSFRRSAIRGRAMGMSYDKPDYPASLPEVWWSPDSMKLIAAQTTIVPEPRVHYVEIAPKPKLQSYPYLKAGDEIPTRTLRLFDLESKREVPVSQQLLENPWSVGEFRWERDSSRFTFLFNQRGHQVLRVCAIDAASGELSILINEESASFINYSNKTLLRFLDDSEELIWMSERDGWNHLYLFDAATGELKNQITKGEWVVRGVDKIDPENRQIHFRACGIREGQDPYHIHHCRVNFDGSGLNTLTEGDGAHEIKWSPDRRWFVDTWSRVDLPPVHELRDAEGELVVQLETCDASEIPQFPERFVAKGRDGETDIFGIVHWPKNFDPSKKYPVIENIYAGPHDQHVPKAFRSRYAHQRQIVDHGFMVVQIDGMGTNWRSKAFLDVAWKNLGDAGFPDRIAWIRAAAEHFKSFDVDRIGIYGGSAGGQNAAGAVMRHGDFYKAAVADCGCHDNRMDKIWWSEAWMGWPVGEHYSASSNVDQAHRLTGKLLLVVGGQDRNVDPASTLQVADALIKADKDFELLVIPGSGHGCAETPYGSRRRLDFFVKHLFE